MKPDSFINTHTITCQQSYLQTILDVVMVTADCSHDCLWIQRSGPRCSFSAVESPVALFSVVLSFASGSFGCSLKSPAVSDVLFYTCPPGVPIVSVLQSAVEKQVSTSLLSSFSLINSLNRYTTSLLLTSQELFQRKGLKSYQTGADIFENTVSLQIISISD